MDIQVVVAAPDDSGRRGIDIYARTDTGDPGTAGGDDPWTLRATGSLGAQAPAPAPASDAAWPPAGAEAVDLDDVYGRFADHGYHYGPAFQGLHAMWRAGEDLFAEIGPPASQAADTAWRTVHPALLDAALHPLVLDVTQAAERDGTREVALPYAWRDVSPYGAGGAPLRVRIARSGPDTVEVTVSDEAGRPVVAVGALVTRPVDPARLGGGVDRALTEVTWVPVPAAPDGTGGWAVLGGSPVSGGTAYAGLDALREAVAAGTPVPQWVVVDAARGSGDVPRDVREAISQVLGPAREWLADERFADARLAVVTHGAVAAAEGDRVEGLEGSAVWGMLRAAQLEAPGRFVLVDVDEDAESAAAVPGLLAGGEPQLAVRRGRGLAPRLARPKQGGDEDACAPWDPDGTILITGGTGALGALVARHLAATREAPRLLLVSRRGRTAPGVPALEAELRELGALVTVSSCDIGEPDQLAGLLASVPADHPLTAVVHTAAVIDDGLVGSLTPERFDTVLRAKADAAWHLHESTAGLPLAGFVLFSSVAGVLGNAGQANYAAANAFLDALAERRRAEGLPATSIAWGLWERSSGLTGDLDRADQARLDRTGLVPISDEEGLAMFDAAVAGGPAVVVATRLNTAALRAEAAAGRRHPLLGNLVPAPAGRTGGATGGGPTLAQRLARTPEPERHRLLLTVVRGHIATVLGHADADPASISAERGLLDMGFDSLTAVELRNRLNAESGLRLPTTLVFDHPTPAAVATFLQTELAAEPAGPDLAVLAELDRLEAALAVRDPGDDGLRGAVTARLQELVRRWTIGDDPADPDDDVQDLAAATDEELFDALDNELGMPPAGRSDDFHVSREG